MQPCKGPCKHKHATDCKAPYSFIVHAVAYPCIYMYILCLILRCTGVCLYTCVYVSCMHGCTSAAGVSPVESPRTGYSPTSPYYVHNSVILCLVIEYRHDFHFTTMKYSSDLPRLEHMIYTSTATLPPTLIRPESIQDQMHFTKQNVYD